MDINTRLKAEMIAAGLKMATGYAPEVTERPDGRAYLIFNASEIPKVRRSIELLTAKAAKGGRGNVSVALAPVLAPLAFKYILPVLAVIFAGGYFLGRVSK